VKGILTNPLSQDIKASAFYPAEEYHQDYYLKNPDTISVIRQVPDGRHISKRFVG